MLQLIDFGAHVDLLTKREMDESLDRAARQWYERAAGIDYVTRLVPNVGEATYQIPGPDQGWAWDMRMVSANLSAGSGDLAVYWDSDLTLVAGAEGQFPAFVAWGSHQVVLKPGRPLYVTCSTGTITSLLFAAVQVPAERLGLIVS